eukprot:CAMPEP_0206525322 /NCGR_PEP_ID=MMETSP0324_2-20121206/68666_1 /ASSEMBLY_ACC=CAM_ASM_000836 /TAXON_ID=2866 /ORGANISM="Crypthecodinium cohnii, Strain Seligo" /LENGTH=206 /DNA_ID=CAMNT_0054019969 /DNA_START=370 /DNA_END=989 /DNA_ORIENTATION=-
MWHPDLLHHVAGAVPIDLPHFRHLVSAEKSKPKSISRGYVEAHCAPRVCVQAPLLVRVPSLAPRCRGEVAVGQNLKVSVLDLSPFLVHLNTADGPLHSLWILRLSLDGAIVAVWVKDLELVLLMLLHLLPEFDEALGLDGSSVWLEEFLGLGNSSGTSSMPSISCHTLGFLPRLLFPQPKSTDARCQDPHLGTDKSNPLKRGPTAP